LIKAIPNIDRVDSDGKTPLYHAICGKNDIEAAKLLMQAGANPNKITS
jgi:ankyrin repeat protein